MLDIRFISENLQQVKDGLKNRHSTVDLDEVLVLYADKKKLILESEKLQNTRNTVSKEIGVLQKQKVDASQLISEMKKVGDTISELQNRMNDLSLKLDNLLLHIPNLPLPGVPEGEGTEQNKLLKQAGQKPSFDFQPKPHWEIAENLGLIDFKRATKLSGARFAVYRGLGAKLEMALIRFMLDIQTNKNGYTMFIPPFLVNAKTMTGTGQLPKFKDDLFKCENADLYLIPTAEVPLTNLHMDEILEEESLPLNYAAYTPCFRSEAGSWGKDTRGLIRQHQFNKVELVKFTRPEDSEAEHQKLTDNAESVLQALGLAYQVLVLCTGDMGFSAAKCHDVEVWLPGQNCYREISSCSNCTDFQARRANIKFKRKDTKKNEFVHTLNGSGLAVGRTFLAILENFQTNKGTVIIPEALRSYMDGLAEIS